MLKPRIIVATSLVCVIALTVLAILVMQSRTGATRSRFPQCGILDKKLDLVRIVVDGSSGYVDPQSWQVAIPPSYFHSAIAFSDGMAWACKEPGAYGYINSHGDWLILPQFELARDFCAGLAPVRSKGKWGVISKTGSWILPPRFDDILCHCRGRIIVVERQFALKDDDRAHQYEEIRSSYNKYYETDITGQLRHVSHDYADEQSSTTWKSKGSEWYVRTGGNEYGPFQVSQITAADSSFIVASVPSGALLIGIDGSILAGPLQGNLIPVCDGIVMVTIGGNSHWYNYKNDTTYADAIK